MHRWRLIVDGPASGPWNMGVDEALLATAVERHTATLRFYRWSGPWLSLGHRQVLDLERAEACRAVGVGVVGRVTGGRAVLHGGDLTYAVAAPEAAMPDGLWASYAWISRALLAALGELGVECEAPAIRTPQADRGNFDCFASAAGGEILAAGRKLAGSAQRRVRGGVLQHGSIRVETDPPEVRRACALADTGATSLAERGHAIGFDVLAAACVRAFRRVLDRELEPGALDERERSAAATRSRSAQRARISPPRSPRISRNSIPTPTGADPQER